MVVCWLTHFCFMAAFTISTSAMTASGKAKVTARECAVICTVGVERLGLLREYQKTLAYAKLDIVRCTPI